jgi:alkylation response protein AidB-like acyl-CoA dehydrogenase
MFLPGGGNVVADSFRRELRAWLSDNLPRDVVNAGRRGIEAPDFELLRDWNRRLADAGWAAPAWPVAHGGRGAGIDEQLAYFEEMSAFDAPGPINAIGVSNIAPAIMSWGSAEQQGRFLRPMLRGDTIWSQGMSEPDSGSDLASLRTSAVLDGDDFVVTGQKTWNSLGHRADWCQLYVRTDPGAPKHKGISCLLVDLRTPGVEARPLRTMTGQETFAELFFDGARIPRAALLGPLHGGWQVAITTLSYERAGVARLHLATSRKLARLLAAVGPVTDPRSRDQLALLYSRIACMRWTTDRSLALAREGQPSATLGGLGKLAWARAEQQLGSLAVSLVGLSALAGDDGGWGSALASSPQTSIAGGTSEINRNILAEQGLGLPR